MKAVARTDKGMIRSRNEDAVFASIEAVGSLPNLLIAADGMGGHAAGDYCSSSLVERIVRYVEETPDKAPVRLLRNAIGYANRELFREAGEDPRLQGMGSTLVAAVVSSDEITVFNIGDSRLYVLMEGENVPRQITRDHSFVEEMVEAGRMVRGSEFYYKNKNIITRAVGIGEEVDADIFDVPTEGVKMLLLCTDGLSNMVGEEEIGQILLSAGSCEDAAEMLINEANRNGGNDNISAVVAELCGKEAAV